jgi:hypothetical protein
MDLRSAHEPATIFHRPAARHIFRSPRFHRRIGWRDWRRDCIGTDHLAVCNSHRLGCNSDRPYRIGLGCRGEIELRRNKNSCQPRRPKYPDVRAHRALLWSRHARSGWLGPYPSRKGGWWDESHLLALGVLSVRFRGRWFTRCSLCAMPARFTQSPKAGSTSTRTIPRPISISPTWP